MATLSSAFMVLSHHNANDQLMIIKLYVEKKCTIDYA